MKPIIVDLPEELLRELNEAWKKLRYGSRAAAIRAGIRLIVKEAAEKRKQET